AILRDKHNRVPIARTASIALVNTTKRDSYAQLGATRGIGPNQTKAAFDYLAEAMGTKFSNVRMLTAEDALQGSIHFEPGECVVAVTENYPLPGVDFEQSRQAQIIRSLAEQVRDRLIVAALRDPYELSQFPDVDTYVCAFSFRPGSAQAMAEVLCGEFVPA